MASFDARIWTMEKSSSDLLFVKRVSNISIIRRRMVIDSFPKPYIDNIRDNEIVFR